MISILLLTIVEFYWTAGANAKTYEFCSRPSTSQTWTCQDVGNVTTYQTEPPLDHYFGVKSCGDLVCSEIENLDANGLEVSTIPPGKPVAFGASRL